MTCDTCHGTRRVGETDGEGRAVERPCPDCYVYIPPVEREPITLEAIERTARLIDSIRRRKDEYRD